MNGKQLFKKHYTRLVLEGILLSAFGGLAIGFAASFVAALVAWILDFGGIWLAIGVGGGVALVSGILLYFLKYKPNEVEVARRIDRLGLQERMVTMLELRGEDSYIANLQRENARVSLDKVSASGRKIKFRISRLLVIMLTVAFVLAASMTTVVGLAEANDDLKFDNPFEDEDDILATYIPITYLADEGGEIEGETDQLIPPGGSTETVVAVAEDGWVFVGWDDGNENPDRFEKNVTEEWVYIAIFEQIAEGDGTEDSDESNGQASTPEGDEAEDLPEGGDANVESEQNGGNGEKGDGSGSDGNNDGGQGSSEEEGEGKGDGQGLGAGGKWEDSNQFLDGMTYYKDYLDVYYEMAQQFFEENGEIPPELLEFFETYFNSI
ncbi:MAG: phage holin family protein [Clostridia bacterium]|nr:phage holin family protein [Clostridia bacterium]